MLWRLVEADNLVEWTATGTLGLAGTIAEGDDGHHGLVVGDAEEGAQGIGIAHAHDEGVEAHGAGGKHEEGVAHAIVVGSPAVADLVGGLAVEVAGLASLEGGDHEHRGALHVALVEVAYHALHGGYLFGGDGHVVFRGLGVGPRRGFLGEGEELANLGFGDGAGGVVMADATARGDDIVEAGAIRRRSGGLAGA